MPRGDGTGPMGMGSMTGRGLGNCAGYVMHGYPNEGFGFGRGGGGGRGFRKMFCFTGTHSGQMIDEKTLLMNQEEFLEKQLQHIKERLKNVI